MKLCEIYKLFVKVSSTVFFWSFFIAMYFYCNDSRNFLYFSDLLCIYCSLFDAIYCSINQINLPCFIEIFGSSKEILDRSFMVVDRWHSIGWGRPTETTFNRPPHPIKKSSMGTKSVVSRSRSYYVFLYLKNYLLNWTVLLYNVYMKPT